LLFPLRHENRGMQPQEAFMDKPFLTVALPELSDETVAGVHELLLALLTAFESHYFGELQRLHQQQRGEENRDY
jgi:hypothetical protein